MKKRMSFVLPLSAMLTAASLGIIVSANDLQEGSLTDLKVEDVAKLVDFEFDPATTTYDITVFEDVYGVRFTPTITGARSNTVSVTMSGSDIEETTIEVAKNEQFELHLTEARECSAFEKRAMEDDCDYSVVIEAANDTYTINVHRPGADGLAGQFEEKSWDMGDGKQMTYYLYVPADYSEEKEYPVVVVPHGGGQFAVPSKDTLIRTAQATTFAKYKKEAIVIVPHGNYSDLSFDGDFGWVEKTSTELKTTAFGDAVYDILMDVCENYSVDSNRISVVGASMGGVGTMGIVAAHPETYAAAVIGCPAVFAEGREALMKYFADQVKDSGVALWLIHSEADPTIDYSVTADLRTVLDACGVKYNATIYSDTDYLWPTAHFCWVPFLADEANLDWILAQSK